MQDEGQRNYNIYLQIHTVLLMNERRLNIYLPLQQFYVRPPYVSRYYCPAGTAVMIACPRGTYNPDRGGISEAANCRPCDPGLYCNGTALIEPTGQ